MSDVWNHPIDVHANLSWITPRNPQQDSEYVENQFELHVQSVMIQKSASTWEVKNLLQIIHGICTCLISGRNPSQTFLEAPGSTFGHVLLLWNAPKTADYPQESDVNPQSCKGLHKNKKHNSPCFDHFMENKFSTIHTHQISVLFDGWSNFNLISTSPPPRAPIPPPKHAWSTIH